MTQVAVPDADIDVASWTNSPLWSKANADDDTDATSETVGNNTNTSIARLGLETLTDPVGNTLHVMRVRWHHLESGRTLQGNMELWITTGPTQIATAQVTPDITITENEFTYNLTTGEADSITDYADLEVRLWGRGTSGGPSRALHIDYFSFEVPDAVAGDTSLIVPRKPVRHDLLAPRTGW